MSAFESMELFEIRLFMDIRILVKAGLILFSHLQLPLYTNEWTQSIVKHNEITFKLYRSANKAIYHWRNEPCIDLLHKNDRRQLKNATSRDLAKFRNRGIKILQVTMTVDA